MNDIQTQQMLLNANVDPTQVARQALSLGQMEGKIKRFELVELGLPGGIPNGSTGRINFQDQAQLRNQPGQIIIITAIELYLDTVYAKSQFNNTLPGFPPADLPNAVLCLYVDGEESIHYIPLSKLNHIDDGVNPFQWDLEGVDRLSNVDWDKSYVQFSAATTGGPYIIPFGVKYFRFKFDPALNILVEK